MKHFYLALLATACISLPTSATQQPSSPTSPPGKGTLSTTALSSFTRPMPASVKTFPIAPSGSTSAFQLPGKFAMQAPTLTGRRVMTYQTLGASLAPSGGLGTTTITANTTPGEYTISNFWEHGFNVTATINEVAGTISIPNQQIANIEGVGAVEIAFCSPTGDPDRTQPVTGTILADGTIAIDTWWGIYGSEGTYKDLSFGWYHTTRLYIPNGTMRETRRDGTTPTPGEYAIVASQQGNVLSVLNFANHGFSVDLVLSDDRTSVIEQQLAAQDVQHGNIYTAAIASYTDEAVTLNPTIYTSAATDNRNISWTNWTLRSSTSYFGYLATGSITTEFDITYPARTTSLEGEGTLEKPYLLKSVADLNFLGHQSEADTTTGKYYALANDIDMSGIRFRPIGTAEHPFAGIINGRGFKIKNLHVERTSEGYAALFGYVSAIGELRNLYIDKPHVTSTGRYNAALVAWTDGDIFDCTVMMPSVGSDYSYTAGMAAHARNIQGCKVYSGTVAGIGGMTSGMASEVTGNISDSGVADCIVYAGATSSATISGGLVAHIAPGGSITDSYFSGVVSGRPTTNRGQTMGGLAGHAEDVDIQRCFALATIENYTDEAFTGGIAGRFSGNMSDCYSAGRINASASLYTGGLIGVIVSNSQSAVKNCYTSAETLASSSSHDDPTTICRELIGSYTPTTTLTNIYFDSNICRLDTSSRGLSTAQLTSASGPSGFDASVWTFAEGLYPRLTSSLNAVPSAQSATSLQFQGADHIKRITTDTPVKKLGSTRLQFLVNGRLQNNGRGADIDGTTIKLNGQFATDTLVILYNPTDFYYHVVQFAPKQFDGEGTAESPYLIKSAADMNRLAEITTVYRQPFADTYFRLTNDIDFAGDTTYQGIANVAYNSHVRFNGHFDGAGYSIKNLKMGKVVWYTAPKQEGSWVGGLYEVTKQSGFAGLFGTLDSRAVIENLTIDSSCVFEGGNYCAAFAISSMGRISNCRNYAVVRTLGNYAAGFTCNNSGVIEDCLNAGNIHANGAYGAGFACNNFGSLHRVVNVGDIKSRTEATVFRAPTPSSMYCGGIVAYNNGRDITDAINAGTVTSPTAVGGIVGYNPQYGSGAEYNGILRSLNYGMVIGETANIGSIVGQGLTSGKIEHVYWDNQILPILPNAGAFHSGMIASETAALTSGNLPEGFSEEVWTCTAGMYPRLKCWADDPYQVAAAQTVVTLAAGDKVNNMTKPATMASVPGLTWALSSGTGFTIEGNTINIPNTVTAPVTDVLTAINGTYKKVINLSAIPELTLQGEGTEASPYQVASVADWDTLANYVIKNKVDMAGSFVKIMNDIDFTGKDFTPISGSQWNATLMGNNHKLTGISHTFTAGKMGAVAKLGPSGRIMDLTIEGDFIQTKGTYAAAFVGECYGQIINCVNRAHVGGSKAYRAGFAAIAYQGAVFTDCVNYGNIDATTTSAGNAAGIVSEVKGPSTFTRCKNYGLISGGTYCAGIVSKSLPSTFIECANMVDQNNDVSYWGGIVASANGNASFSDTYVFERCYNIGNLATRGNVAGIIASAGSSYTPMRISGCYNTGNITAQGTVGTAAGLFASLGRGSHVTDCYNTGNIKVLNDKSNGGGLIVKSGAGESVDDPSIIENCYNTGNVDVAGALAGGICVQTSSYITFRNCYNEGTIKAGTYTAGGILANNLGSEVRIEYCRNMADVTVGTNRAGGIAGNTQTNRVYISRCVNVGNVSTTCTLVGTTETGTSATGHAIGGLVGQGGPQIEDCYNIGNVKGANQVGGLVGQPYARSGNNYSVLSIARCYNMGNVQADAALCGPIVGINTQTPEKDTYWNNEVTISETYWLDGCCTSTLPVVGLGLTKAQLGQLDLGSAWIKGDDFSYPILVSHSDIHPLLLYAAAIHFAAGESEAKVTRSFNVGCPDGVVWSSSDKAMIVDGTRIHVTNEAFTGTVMLTATAGEHSRQYPIYIDKLTGVDDVTIAIPVSVRYFTISGVEVADKDLQPGGIYVAISKYADGSVRSSKVVIR